MSAWLPVAQDGTFWFPPQSSTNAAPADWVFFFILGLSAFFFILIVGVMTFFVLRYRRRQGVPAQATAHHSMALELTWTLIPLGLVGAIFYFGFVVFLDQRVQPNSPYEIMVTGRKWSWSFTYSNGVTDRDLHVPLDTDVRLVMSSDDVIHSLFIPAFRVKFDLVPGRITKLWFKATQEGQYPLLCAEYCGTEHSNMSATVHVHRSGEFEKWLNDSSSRVLQMSPRDLGARLYVTKGCASCHSLDGKASWGPSFKNIFGRQHVVREDGKEIQVLVDENYLRESILDPQKKVVVGPYSAVMPTYQGRIKDQEINGLIEYIKSLKDTP
jgi:cytochrome c oxidase subunit 2